MAHYVAQVTMPYLSGLPADVVVNSFHFDAVQATDSLEEIADALQDFYTGDDAQNRSVSAWMGAYVSRVVGAASIKIYDWALPEPRPPIWESTFTLDAPSQASNLPLEVALCTSYAAAPIAGVPRARQRGRVFIGPLIGSANTSATGQPPRPDTVLVEDLAAATLRLASLGSSPGLPKFSVFSRVDQTLYTVDHGWVDNEFDTQRRRQVKATGRSAWLVP